MVELKLNPVYSRLRDTGLYKSRNMNAPLAEQGDNVVQFELTTGCSHNACTYCQLFKDEHYSVREDSDFKFHVSKVLSTLGYRGELENLERIFIGNGDALSVPTEQLRSAINYSIGCFNNFTGKLPRRIAMYASINNVLTKDVAELKRLHCGGTCYNCSQNYFGRRIGLELIYLGLETGDSELLKFVRKGYDEDSIFEASERIRQCWTSRSKLQVSAFIMPGLGGVRFFEQHVRNTLKALNNLRPQFINIMSIHAHPDLKYAKKMKEEKTLDLNRALTSEELREQIARFVEGFDFDTTLGCFDNSGYLGVDTNVVQFPSRKIRRLSYFDKSNLVDEIRRI